MSSLDDKLREIAEFCFNRGVGAGGMDDIEDPDDRDRAYLNIKRKTKDEAITQIKQAFADEGYVQIPMTGQEWYERFMDDLKGEVFPHGETNTHVAHAVNRCMEAAKKAAGIE